VSSFFKASADRKRRRFITAIEGLVSEATVSAASIGKGAEEISRIQQSIRNNYPLPRARPAAGTRPRHLFLVK
jgi:hypothetical protein